MDAAPQPDEETQDTAGLSGRQRAQRATLLVLAEAFGQFDQTTGRDGSHYAPAAVNPFKAAGIRCENCCFWEDGACEIVAGEIEAAAVCKLWIIPEDRISE